MSQKCQQCGLVNWEQDELCKRCGAFLNKVAPPVYKWFVAYCVLMALLYLSLPIFGVVFLFIEPDQDMSAMEARVMGVVFIVFGLLFFLPYAAAPFLPRESWVWVLGLVLICLGFGSLCCFPVCIPLLIFWLKPEMKAFYGRGLTPSPPRPPPPPQF